MRTAAKVWNHFTKSHSSGPQPEAEAETIEVTTATNPTSMALCRYCGNEVSADLVLMGAHLRSCEKCPANVRFKFSADRSERRPLRAPAISPFSALHSSSVSHPSQHPKNDHSVADAICPPNVSLALASSADLQSQQNHIPQQHLLSAGLSASLLEMMKRPLASLCAGTPPSDPLLASLEPLLKRARTDVQQTHAPVTGSAGQQQSSTQLSIDASPADMRSSSDAGADTRSTNAFSVERLLMPSSRDRYTDGERERETESERERERGAFESAERSRPTSALAALISADRRASSAAAEHVHQRSQSIDPSELLSVSRAHKVLLQCECECEYE